MNDEGFDAVNVPRQVRGPPGSVGSATPTRDTGPDLQVRVQEIESQMEREWERSAAIAADLVGVDEHIARSTVTAAAREFRVARRDDERFRMTLDRRPKRITVEIEQGKVVSARAG